MCRWLIEKMSPMEQTEREGERKDEEDNIELIKQTEQKRSFFFVFNSHRQTEDIQMIVCLASLITDSSRSLLIESIVD